MSLSKRSVLIVDNDPEIRNVLTLLLAPDYDVTAVDSADAAECVFHNRQSVDIILTDQKRCRPSGAAAFNCSNGSASIRRGPSACS